MENARRLLLSVIFLSLHVEIKAGRPDSPSPSIVSIDATTLQLQWEAPVAWPATFGVMYYELKMYNSSSGEWRKWILSSRDNVTYIDDTVTLQRLLGFDHVATDNTNEVSVVISARHVPLKCDGLVFYVSAGNGVGKSDSRALRAAFQTGVQWPAADSLMLVPLCRSDGVTLILTRIAAPKMCDHYPHNYSIFFNWTLGVKAIFLSERPDNEMTYLAAMEDIPLDGVYGVTVSVSVMTSSGSVMGTASGMVQAGCGSAMLKGSLPPTTTTASSTTGQSSPEGGNICAIAGGVGGGVGGALLLAVIIVIVVVVILKTKGGKGGSKKSEGTMELGKSGSTSTPGSNDGLGAMYQDPKAIQHVKAPGGETYAMADKPTKTSNKASDKAKKPTATVAPATGGMYQDPKDIQHTTSSSGETYAMTDKKPKPVN